MLRRLLALAALACLAIAPSHAEEPLKVGYVYVSPVGDAGWTYQHDLGRQAVEEAFGERVKTAFVEAVPEGADAERVIRSFAAKGFDLVFTTSFGYMNPTVKVARRFPQVKFEHATGYKRADNLATYLARFYEARYLAGMVAGGMSESGTVGYVAAFPIPEVVRGINAFTRGLRAVNPQAQVRVIWTNSWYDPGKEREAAETLIAQGADVLTQHTDSTAPVQTAQDRGVWAIGYHSDMSHHGPKAHLTAAIHDWRDYYVQRVQAVLDGSWESTAIWGGLAEGMVDLAPYHEAVPQALRQRVAEAEAAIVAGDLHPFGGPVYDQAGAQRVAEGEALADPALLKMNWYVRGVVGKLPQ